MRKKRQLFYLCLGLQFNTVSGRRNKNPTLSAGQLLKRSFCHLVAAAQIVTTHSNRLGSSSVRDHVSGTRELTALRTTWKGAFSSPLHVPRGHKEKSSSLNLHAGCVFALREKYFKAYGSSPRQNMHKNNSKIKHSEKKMKLINISHKTTQIFFFL